MSNRKKPFHEKEKYVLTWLYQKKLIEGLIVKQKNIVNICKVDLNLRTNSYSNCILNLYSSIKKGRLVVRSGYLKKQDATKNKPTISKKYKITKRINFYRSKEWRSLRVRALLKYGKKCCLCGRTSHDGIVLHVDHIKPRSKYPRLELNIDNLQILCEDCNIGKSNKYKEDWRKKDKIDIY